MSQFGSSIPEYQFDTTQDQQFPDTYAMAPDQTASMEASSYSPINEPDQNSVAPTPTYEDMAALENVQLPDIPSGNYIPGLRPQAEIDEINQSRYAPTSKDRWMGDSFDQLNDPQGMYPWESAPEEPPVPNFEQMYGRPPSRNEMLGRIQYSERMQGVSQSTVLGIPIGLYRNDESAATVIERDNVARGLRDGNDLLLKDYIAQGKANIPRGVVSNLAKAVGQGYEQVAAGMNSVLIGVPAAAIAAFTGNEVAADTAKLAFAYARYLDNDVKYNGAKGGSDFEQYVLDVATGFPQIAFQTSAALLSAPFGLSNVTFALTGAGFAGGAQLNDSYLTYKDAGLSDQEAFKAALYDSMAAATSTAVTEYISGKVIGFDKLPTARMALNMTAVKAFAKGAARGGLAETTQETLDQFGSDFLINLHRLDMEEFKEFYKQNPDWVKQTFKNAAYAGLVALPLGAIPGSIVGVRNFQAAANLTNSVNLRIATLPEDHPIRKMVEQDEMSIEDASVVVDWLADKEAKARVQERADVQYRRQVGNALDFSAISDDQLKTIILMGADGTTARIAGSAEDAGTYGNLDFAIHPEMAADELVRRGVISGSLQGDTAVANPEQGTLTGLTNDDVDAFVAANPEVARELAAQEAPISRKQMERLFGKPFAGNSEAARAEFKENLLSVMRDETGAVRRVEESRARKSKAAARSAIESLTGLSGADLERVALGLSPENAILLREEQAKTRQEAIAGGTLALKDIADRRARSSMTEANVARGTAETRAGAMSPRALAAERERENAEAERVKVTVARIALEDASQRFVDAFKNFSDSVTDTFSGNIDLAMIAWQAYLVVNELQSVSGLTLDYYDRFGGVDQSAVDAFNTIVNDITNDDNARMGAADRAAEDVAKIIEESKLRAALAIAIEDSNIISDPAHVVSRPNAIKTLLGLSLIETVPDTELDDETIKDVAVVIESGSALGVELRGVVDSNPALADLVDAVDVETIQSLEAEGNHEARLLTKIDNIRRGLDPVTADGTPSKERVANAIRAAVISEQAAAAKVMNDLVQQRAALEKQRSAMEGAARFYPDGRPRGVRAKKTDEEKKLEKDIDALDLKIGGQRLVTEEISGRLGQTSEGVHVPPVKVERTETFPSASAEARLQTILSARNQIATVNAVDASDIDMRWDDGETVLTTQERYLINFGNKLGITVVFVKASKPIKTNGAQQDGVVFINSAMANNPASMWAIAVHETIHALAKTSPQRFNDLLKLLRSKAPRALRIQSERWFRLRAMQIETQAPVAAATKLFDELAAGEDAENQVKQFLWFVRNGTGKDLDNLRANLPATLANALNNQGLFESNEEQSAAVVKRFKALVRSVKAAAKPTEQTLAEEEVAGVATMLMDAAFFSFVDENGKPDYDKLERLADGPRASRTLAGITSVIQDIMTVLKVPLALRGMNSAQVNAVRRLADGKLEELANPKRREMVASLFAKSLLQMMEVRKGKVDLVDGLDAKPLTQAEINNEIPPLDDSDEDGGVGPRRPTKPRKPTGGKGKGKGGTSKKPTSTPSKEPIDEDEEDRTDVADPNDVEDQEVVNDEPWMDDAEEEQEPKRIPEKPKKAKAKKEKPTIDFDNVAGFEPTLGAAGDGKFMALKDVMRVYGLTYDEFVSVYNSDEFRLDPTFNQIAVFKNDMGLMKPAVAAVLRYAQIARAGKKVTPKPSKKSGAPDLKPAAKVKDARLADIDKVWKPNIITANAVRNRTGPDAMNEGSVATALNMTTEELTNAIQSLPVDLGGLDLLINQPGDGDGNYGYTKEQTEKIFELIPIRIPEDKAKSAADQTKPSKKFVPVRNERLTDEKFEKMFEGVKGISLLQFNEEYRLTTDDFKLSRGVQDFIKTDDFLKLSKKDKASFGSGFLSLKTAKLLNDFLDKNSFWTNDGGLKYITQGSGNEIGTSLNNKAKSRGYTFAEAADLIGLSLSEFNRIKNTIAFTGLKKATVATSEEIRAVSIANFKDRIAETKSKKAKDTDAEIDQSISGDETVDPKTKTPAFRKWFGKSKVSRNGNPIVVYHGTNETAFDAFSPESVGKNVKRKIDGFYFSDEQENAKGYGKRIIPVYLSLQNPLIVDFDGLNFDGINIDEDTGKEEKIFSSIDELVAEAKRDGYDGLIAMNVADVGLDGDERIVGTTFVAFDPKQIKATTNSGAFSTETANIDQSIGNNENTLTDKELAQSLSADVPNFVERFKNSKVRDAAGKLIRVFHGTGKATFDKVNPYAASEKGLFGMGAYFTENQDVASEYARKKGVKPKISRSMYSVGPHKTYPLSAYAESGVYPAYLALNNPLDMDDFGDVDKWATNPIFKEAGLERSDIYELVAPLSDKKQYVKYDRDRRGSFLTNEAFYKVLRDVLAQDIALTRYEGEEQLQSSLEKMGYDSITHMGGGRVVANSVKHRVWIAFHDYQVESAIGGSSKFEQTITDIVNDPQAKAKLDAADTNDHVAQGFIDQAIGGNTTLTDVVVNYVPNPDQIITDLKSTKLDKTVAGKHIQAFAVLDPNRFLRIKNAAKASFLQNFVQQVAIKSPQAQSARLPELLVDFNTMLGYKKSQEVIFIDPYAKFPTYRSFFSTYINGGNRIIVTPLPTEFLKGNFNSYELDHLVSVLLHELAHAVTSPEIGKHLGAFVPRYIGVSTNIGASYENMRTWLEDAHRQTTVVNGKQEIGLAPKEFISLARLYFAVLEDLRTVGLVGDDFKNAFGQHPDNLAAAFVNSAGNQFGNTKNPQQAKYILHNIGYGLGNLDEFVAMGANDPFFRPFLKNIEIDRVDRGDTLKEGEDVRTNVLDELTRLTSVIANDETSWLQPQEKPIRYRPLSVGVFGDNAITRIPKEVGIINPQSQTRFERLLADAAGGFASIADIESTLDQSLTADVVDRFDAVQNQMSRLFNGVKGIAKRVGTKETFPYVSLDSGDEDIEILSRNKDVSPLWKYIAAPLNLAIASKIAPVIKIVEDLIDADMRRNMVTASRFNEAKAVWASIPRSERKGEEFAKYMDEYYDPATIDTDPEFADKSQQFRDALKWFKTREEIRRTEIIDIRRRAMRKVLDSDNSDEIVEKANNIGRTWSVELGPRSRRMIQTETALITIDEARDELAKEMVPDTWGRQYAHMFHWFQGDLKLVAYKADGTKEIIGSAFTEPEAFQRLAMHKKDNPTEYVKWTAEPAVFINTDEAIALSAAQRNRLRKLLADATGAYSKDVSDAMRGIVTTHSNKRPFYGALIERTGAKGFETDFMEVWKMSERLHNRWTMGGEMIRTVTPQIEELRKSYPAWAEYLTETMQHTLFTKPTVTEQVIDGMVNKMTLGLTSPFFTRRFLNSARALNYARQLFTVRQMAVNSLQPLQTIYPIMGEANFAKAIAFYNTAEAKAILKKYGVFDASGRFREGNETALGADVYDFVSGINTRIEAGTGVNLGAESRNQNFSFIAMYWHATTNLGMSEGEAARYARIYGNVYTQFHYTKANMPYLLRGPVASTALQYRRFAINSLGLLVNEFQRGNYSGAARYLGTLGIMGGFNALVGTSAIGVIYALYRGDKEGADDMNFLLHKYLEDKLGSARAADIAIMGLPAAVGLDISGSISLLNKPFGRNIYEKIGATVAGPTINTLIQTATNLSAETAVEMGYGERATRAIIDSSPSVQPLITMMKMVNGDHAYQDAKGRKTFELETSDQWMKLLAFRTVTESNWSMEYQRLRIIRAEVDNASDKAATQLASGNRAEAMATLRKFNSMYPLAAITLADIKQRADNKRKSVTMSQLDRRVDLESSAKARKIAKSEGIGQ